MALLFHDGFETGGADAWSSVVGTPAFHADYANTGNYGMQCNTSGSEAGVTISLSSHRRATFYLYIQSTPDDDCIILGGNYFNDWYLVLDTNRYIDLYYGDSATKKADGSTQLSTGQWYRISLSIDGVDSCKVYIGESEEHSATQSGIADFSPRIGALSSVTANLYFDDIAFDDDSSLDNIGDIHVGPARPVGEGTDDDNYTLDEHGWADSSEAADAVYTEINNDPDKGSRKT